MNAHGLRITFIAAGLLGLTACSGSGSTGGQGSANDTVPASATSTAPQTSAVKQAVTFVPPSEASIPDNAFGAMVRKGRTIFMHTQTHAGKYVGNGLNCSNCHLDAGRRANSAPLWAAWGMYPAYRKKNGHVNTFTERLQGCFVYSMNGKAPPAGSQVIVALESYSYWMSRGAPTGVVLPGRGFPKQGFKPPQPPDFARGEKVFASHCALCHGKQGQGQKVAGAYVFPPLWGPDSFNWGAGMHRINTAASFILHNMPFGRPGTLTVQQAWDVAAFMDAHPRPQDPRFDGHLKQTVHRFHGHRAMDDYGKTINGFHLGAPGTLARWRKAHS